jgi:hypothetical protein
MSHLDVIDSFWQDFKESGKPTQKQRYAEKNSPECIRKFIEIGGGGRMGTTLEEFARHKFKNLSKRDKKKKGGKKNKKNKDTDSSDGDSSDGETGYDQIIHVGDKKVYIEQKSSGHWGDDNYKWQHVEVKHKWDMLLLCGIDYDDIKFWVMNKVTFNSLITKGKITNQGEKNGKSSEGMWFDYSVVKDYLIEVKTQEDLLQFASSRLDETVETNLPLVSST